VASTKGEQGGGGDEPQAACDTRLCKTDKIIVLSGENL